MYINNLITGSLTLGSGGSTPAYHADTWYKYANDTEWRTVSITGKIVQSSIPDIQSVTAIELGSDVTSIGDGFIYRYGVDNSLTSITIGPCVTEIEEGAFYECVFLPSLTIPNNVTNIGELAFEDCSRLFNVTFEGKDKATVQAMDNYPFGLNIAGQPTTTIHCTDGDITIQYEGS